MKSWQLLRDVCLWHMLHTQGRDAHLCLNAFIFMPLLHKSKNERLVFTQGRDAHLCLLAFYLHVLIIYN